MQSVSTALNRLHDDTGWFARAHELRLLVIRCSGGLRTAVLSLLAGFEYHADNRSPWIVLGASHTASDAGWQIRANALAEQWQSRVEAFGETGVVLRGVSAPATGTGEDAFRTTAAAVLRAVAEPLAGLVLVLAPPVVDDVAALEADLSRWMAAPELGGARWVLVLDGDLALPNVLLRVLGEHALVCDCRVDEAEQRRDLSALLEGAGPVIGVAAPRGVAVPPHVTDPPPLDPERRDASLHAQGIDPAYLDEAPALQREVLAAAIAMSEGKGPLAIETQRRATERAARLGQHEIEVTCRIGLASYLSGLGQRPLARRELEAAVQTARAHALQGSESQAWLALGLVHALDGEIVRATEAYVTAARAAEAGGNDMLAIEGYRMAGQLAAQHRHDPQAIAAWNEAIRVAKGSPRPIAAQSGAAETARQLAALCGQHGLKAQASALFELADAIEHGEVGREDGTTPEPARVQAG